MAARKKRNPSPTSTKTSSGASNPRKQMQANTAGSSVCSSSSFHKGKRGRPKKLVIATRGNGNLKSSIIKSPSGTTDSTFTTTKKLANPEIPNSKNEKLEISSAATAGEVDLKDTAIPQQSSTPVAFNEGSPGPGDSSSHGIQPPSPLPNSKGKKSQRKGKPNRAHFS